MKTKLVLLICVSLLLASCALARELSFADRLQAQEAIERVYYSHQVGATDPFESAVPATVIEKKVRAVLEGSVESGERPRRARASRRSCESLGLVVQVGDKVQTSVSGRVRDVGEPVAGSVTRMTPTSVFCQNVTTAMEVQVAASGTSWDCRAMGLLVSPDDEVITGANGTVN